MEFKGTKGILRVEFSEKWPFHIETLDENDDVVFTERLCAHSTVQNSFNDAKNAVGFNLEERRDIKNMIERQIADAKIRAAAPELLEALQEAVDGYEWNKKACPENWDKSDDEHLEKCKKAIYKALH